MVIRDEQISVLDRNSKAGFTQQLAAYLRARHGSTMVRLSETEISVTAMLPERLEELVHAGMARAGRYGISWQSALASYVVTMFVVAPNFDEDRRVHDLLTDADIEPNYRMDSVMEQISDDDWNAIGQSYDIDAWGALYDV